MGWMYLYECSTRQSLIKNRTATEKPTMEGIEFRTFTTLAHTLRGNCLWKVVEVTGPGIDPERFIALDLIGYDKYDKIWGYKDMEESMGPYYYSCPLKYLDMVPKVGNEAWRKAVREYHAKASRKLAVGEVYATPGCSIPSVTILSTKPLRVRGANGGFYRISKKLLGEKIG